MSTQQIGKYEVVSTLGRGSMGVVYKARDPEIGRLVAIKTLRAVFMGDDPAGNEALKRFRQESRSAGMLRHPNIVTIFEAGRTDKGTPYIVMEFIEGDSLEKIISERCPLDPKEAFHYLAQIASALDYAHSQGVIHRDIKPSNVIIDGLHRPLLLDFGVAKLTDTSLTPAGMVVGTPSYMSPEQIRGEKLDGSSDLFALAVMAYELFTAHRPFSGKDFTTVVNNIIHHDPLSFQDVEVDLPLPLQEVLHRALSKEKMERFPTALEFVNNSAKIFSITVDGMGIIGGFRPGRQTTPEVPETEQDLDVTVAGGSGLDPEEKTAEDVGEAGRGSTAAMSDRMPTGTVVGVKDEDRLTGRGVTSDSVADTQIGVDEKDLSEPTSRGVEDKVLGEKKRRGSGDIESRLGSFFRTLFALIIAFLFIVVLALYFYLPPAVEEEMELASQTEADDQSEDNSGTSVLDEVIEEPSGKGDVKPEADVRSGAADGEGREKETSGKEDGKEGGGTKAASEQQEVALVSQAVKPPKAAEKPQEAGVQKSGGAVKETSKEPTVASSAGWKLKPKRPAHLKKRLTPLAAADLKDEELAFLLLSENLDENSLRLAISQARRRKHEDFTRILAKRVDHPNPLIRIEVLKSLSGPVHSGRLEALKTLVGRLDDDDFLVRGFAAKVLGQIGNPSSLQALELRLAVEQDERVSKVLERAAATLKKVETEKRFNSSLK